MVASDSVHEACRSDLLYLQGLLADGKRLQMLKQLLCLPAVLCVTQLYDYSLATQVAGFENVGQAMLSVFQSMTLTNWSFTMYRTMDFLSPAVVLYWFAMIIFGAYFVVGAWWWTAGLTLVQRV